MGNSIYKIRKKLNLSQEEFANLLDVSKQAIQKWESGKNLPDITHLIMMHNKFNISLDELVLGEEATSYGFRIKPTLVDYAARNPWDEYSKSLIFEYNQSIEEGKDISYLKNLIDDINSLKDSKQKHDLGNVVFDMIYNAPIVSDYKYIEPSKLDEMLPLIRNNHFKKVSYDKDKIEGAILGRIVGCMLGKPVEGVLRKNIRKMLEASNNYPITRYMYKKDLLDDVPISASYLADYMVDGALSDDDLDYVILNQMVIENYGFDFKPVDVLNIWLDSMPKNCYCTAERVAFSNYSSGYLPPDTAYRKNAYREWIGAQIRADYFGYICPGDPLLAAKLAYKDACISHVKNGIYGEMYVAALLAIVAGENDILKACKQALDYIPYTSRLYEALNSIIGDYENGVSETKAFDKIFNRYDDSNPHHWTHTISNASIVVASLLYGNKNFAKSISLAVSAGFDTDCNGATVGSIVGMINGKDCIPSNYTKPLQNRFHTDINRKQVIQIDDFVNMVIKHIEGNENKNISR